MKSLQQQKGISMWGFMFVAAVAIFFAFLFFKLFTLYINDFKVRTALDGMVEQARTEQLSRKIIFETMQKRFDIDDVTHVDLKKDMKITRRKENIVVKIKYEARVPMAFNITALLNFDHSREFAASGFE